jgi:hypothetical protein
MIIVVTTNRWERRGSNNNSGGSGNVNGEGTGQTNRQTPRRTVTTSRWERARSRNNSSAKGSESRSNRQIAGEGTKQANSRQTLTRAVVVKMSLYLYYCMYKSYT